MASNVARTAPEQDKKRGESRARLRRRHLVEKLHRLGPSPLAHFLAELEHGAPLAPTLETYAALPASFIKANGGDKFAPHLFAIGWTPR